MKLQDLTRDEFLEQMKKAKIEPGTKIRFFGETGSKIDVWKTYYFKRFADIGGKEESGAILSPTRDLKTVNSNGQYIGYYYKHGRIKKGGSSGNRPNTYNLMNITDMKIG